MRILLLGMGSRGDVEPMLALGCRLQDSGYAVSLAAAADFRGLVEGRGLDFEPFSFDVQEGATSDLGRRWLGGSSSNQQREAYLMRQVVRYIAEPLADDLIRMVELADAFVASAMTFEAMEPLARRVGKPLVHTMFQPTWPTAHGPSSTFALRPETDSVLNLAWSWGAAFAAWDVLRSPGGVMRRRLRMPRASFREYVAAARRTPTILAASPHVTPPAPNWGRAIRQTGFWFGETDPSWAPPADLAAFLAPDPTPTPTPVECAEPAGPEHPQPATNLVECAEPAASAEPHVPRTAPHPFECAESAGAPGGTPAPDSALSAHSTKRGEEAPVYLGFGSMATDDPAGVVRTFVEALERVGRRGVISAGWARLHHDDLPDTVLAIGEVPHAWLFPQMAAVVHHGGAGTSASAFRAGVPQVVVPHIADQPYWGRRVHELGVGSTPIRRKDFSVDRLAAALGVALSAEAPSAAYALGTLVRAEDGVGDAARIISSLVPPREGRAPKGAGLSR